MERVQVKPCSLETFRSIYGEAEMGRIQKRLSDLKHKVGNRRIVHVNSTPRGGGVAELLHSLVPHLCGIGLRCSWYCMKGLPQEFFVLTKRVHNNLHGQSDDVGILSSEETILYERISHLCFEQLQIHLTSGDIAVLHDPQTAGIAPLLQSIGVCVVWRCHIGNDVSNEYTKRAWKFLRPYLEHIHHFVFTRPAYVPDWIDETDVSIIHPSIHPFATKNQQMSAYTQMCINHHIGLIDGCTLASLLDGRDVNDCVRSFTTGDGRLAFVQHHADILHSGPLPKLEDPMVLQVSRWDTLKDMAGMCRAFADHVLDEVPNAHLALAGPSVHSIADDPGGAAAFHAVVDTWRKLSHFKRSRIQLVCLPMHNPEENAAMVNALQRHAVVICQKSIFEGFGLTATEAMWKGKPVLASRVGGIQDQITHMKDGVLLSDPFDTARCGELLVRLLKDQNLRESLGENAKATVRKRFLVTRHLTQYMELFCDVLEKKK